MAKKNGIKEILMLIVALIVFVVALYGLYNFPNYVTTLLFALETVVFLVIVALLSDKAFMSDREKDGKQPEGSDAGANESDNMTVISAPALAAVGTDEKTETVADVSKKEEPVVREVTKLKTVLFDEALLEEKESVDMGEIVKHTIAVMEPFAMEAGIRTGCVCAGNVEYTGSRKLLTVMMKNIVDNAVKYMRRPGNMHITVSNVADDIFIVCKDDGLGIGKDELPYIFDLNFQGSNRVSGNGLGLTQARDIVNAYGGTIYARSAPGAGMGIYIQLPGTKALDEKE
ncbi:MAG: HAMP domain-containing histidine kinase [Lachnospiraceae bacterium]|nr:HAMP domain-containing histidine kinase [Lachnospiraceae bacterium]